MLGGRFQKRKSRSVIVDVFLEYETYNKFKVNQTKRGLDEGSALVEVLDRGMADYWLQEFKQLKQGYLPMEKMFTEFKRDNELLKALEHENEELKGILKDKSRQSQQVKS